MRLMLLAAFLLLATLAVSGRAQDVFQEGSTITVELQNGDKLTGILEKADQSKLVILHDILGRMEIPRAAIKPAVPKPVVEAVSPWSGSFDLSLNGSGGNTDTQTFRTGLEAKHDEAEFVDTYTAWYRRSTAGSTVDDDKGFAQMRHEWKLKDSLWRPFVQGSYDKDRFADWDSRAAVAAGVAHPLVDTPEQKVQGRLGAGVSRKFGVSDDSVEATTYEALLGLDWNWIFSETNSFNFTTDVYPGINPSGEFRAISRAYFESKVAATSPWFVKVGVDQTYDSSAGAGTESTDWNYYLGLGRHF